jgi:hypothetical protein
LYKKQITMGITAWRMVFTRDNILITNLTPLRCINMVTKNSYYDCRFRAGWSLVELSFRIKFR